MKKHKLIGPVGLHFCLKIIVRAHQTLKSNLYLQAMYCKITWSPPFKLLKPWIVELSVWETVHAYRTTLNQSSSNKTSVSWITQIKSRVLSATALMRIQFTMRTHRYYFFFYKENKRNKMKSECMWWPLILLLSKETLSFCYCCYLTYYYYYYYYYYYHYHYYSLYGVWGWVGSNAFTRTHSFPEDVVIGVSLDWWVMKLYSIN